MRVTITSGEVVVELRAVRLTDGRLAGAVPPGLEAAPAGTDPGEVELVVDDDGRRTETTATAIVVRSGRTWTEARGRLRERRGWARRFARAPAEVVVLSPARAG